LHRIIHDGLSMPKRGITRLKMETRRRKAELDGKDEAYVFKLTRQTCRV